MYMHRENNKICKFNLFKKCKFGNKCKFRHINAEDIDKILDDLRYLKAENDSLKKEVQEKNKTIINLKNNNCDVTPNKMHVSEKRSYSSFFKKNEPESSGKNHKVCREQNTDSEDSGIDDDLVCGDHITIRNTSETKNRAKNCLNNERIHDVEYDELRVEKHNKLLALEERLNLIETRLIDLYTKDSKMDNSYSKVNTDESNICNTYNYFSDVCDLDEQVQNQISAFKNRSYIRITGPGLVAYDSN